MSLNRSPELVRGLGLWASTAVIIGSMIGQGIFLITSQVARDVGSVGRVLTIWLIGGVIVLFATFCYAELGAALPQAGGEYVYLSRGLGPKSGFLFGWTSALLTAPALAATVSSGLLRITAFLLPSVSLPILILNIPEPFHAQPYQFTMTAGQVWAAIAIASVTALNYVGVRTAGRVQILITGLKVAGMVSIVGLGLTLKDVGGMHGNASTTVPASGS